MTIARQRSWTAAFLAPSVGLITVFVFAPIALTVWLSLHKWSTATSFGEAEWVGLDNFHRLVEAGSVGRDFRQALRNTFVYAGLSIGLILPLSVLFGSIVHRVAFRGTTFLRTVLFSTYTVPMIAVAIVWSKLYSPTEGPLNQALGWFGIGPQPWLSDTGTALFSLVLLNVWQQVGYFTVLVVAGLTQIPSSVYEAAALDGARRMRLFAGITLPLLRRTLLFCVVIALINAIQVFEPVAAITQGGPVGSTNVLTFHIREVGIERSQGGLASSMAVTLLLALMVVVSLVFALARRSDDA
jgi:multiple sugar transport system permease protein